MVNLGSILLEILFEGPVSYAKCPQEVTFTDNLEQTRYCPTHTDLYTHLYLILLTIPEVMGLSSLFYRKGNWDLDVT